MGNPKPTSGSLAGFCIASFQSRQSEEMGALVTKRGGDLMRAPTMQEVPLEDNRDAFAFGEKLMAGEVDALVVLTGIGTRVLIEALLTRWDREQVLRVMGETCIIARSGKPVAALRKFGLKADYVAALPNTWEELLAEVDTHGLAHGKHLFIQEYGAINGRLVAGLRERGARVSSVPVYVWQLPDDTTPLQQAIDAVIVGKIDCVLFTSAHQINHIKLVAEQSGRWDALLEAFRDRVVVASVGPFTSEALGAAGLPVEIAPEKPKMGHLVRAVADQLPGWVRRKRAG